MSAPHSSQTVPTLEEAQPGQSGEIVFGLSPDALVFKGDYFRCEKGMFSIESIDEVLGEEGWTMQLIITARPMTAHELVLATVFRG